jgi:hypothetical protein
MTDFIEMYPGAVEPAACRQIIDQFEASGRAAPGRVGSGVDTALKKSLDITITGLPEWGPAESLLLGAAFEGLKQYVRKYPYALIGALALRHKDPTSGEINLINEERFAALSEPPYLRMLHSVFRPGTINVQKYLAGQGGYPHWHSELYPLEPHAETLHRVLLFTVYLNDAFQAGETEFYFQRRTIQPATGSLLIAPAGFTHTHRGNTPLGGDKYIATSWIMFQRAEALYGV